MQSVQDLTLMQSTTAAQEAVKAGEYANSAEGFKEAYKAARSAHWLSNPAVVGARSAATGYLAQTAVGNDPSFSWGSVAASAAGAYIGDTVGGWMQNGSDPNMVSSFVGGVTGGYASAELDPDGNVNGGQIAVDVFGNMVANSIVASTVAENQRERQLQAIADKTGQTFDEVEEAYTTARDSGKSVEAALESAIIVGSNRTSQEVQTTSDATHLAAPGDKALINDQDPENVMSFGAPSSENVTAVRGKDGRIYLHNKTPDDDGRYKFSRNPLTDLKTQDAVSGSVSANLEIASSTHTSELELFENQGGPDLAALRSTTRFGSEAKFDDSSFSLVAGASTASEFRLLADSNSTSLGDFNYSFRSSVELNAEMFFKSDLRDASIDFGGGIGAIGKGVEVAGGFESKKIDLFFLKARVNASGNLNALSGGGSLEGGLSYRNGNGRLYFGAAAATFVGAQVRMDIQIENNQEFTTALVDGIYDFELGAATIPEILSRPEINPLASTGSWIGNALYEWVNDE